MIIRIICALWYVVTTDKVVKIGVPSSSLSLWGGAHLPQAQAYVAFFAALFGGLSAAAVFLYTCIKIYRLLRNPRAVE